MPLVIVLKIDRNNIIKIKFKEYVLTTKEPDNIVLLNSRKFLKIKKIFKNGNEFEIQGNYYREKKSIYTYPFQSSALNI